MLRAVYEAILSEFVGSLQTSESAEWPVFKLELE